MIDVVIEDHLRRARIRGQWLDRAGARSPVDIVRHLVGVQAQLPSAAALAVRARTSRRLTADGVTGAHRLVRTWAMRGTQHLLAAEDVDWLLGLLAPTVLARQRHRHQQLELDAATLRRSVDVLVRLLSNGPRTRTELFDGLAAGGIDPSGQRGIHLIQHAALQRVLCFGADRDGENTWLLREPGAELPKQEALCRLARRYHQAYGPADAGDLAYWAGLRMPDARAAWQAGVAGATEPAAADRPAGSDPPVATLLPHFDPYLLGYRNRDFAVPAEHRRAVAPQGGFVAPTLLVDGRVIGTWRADRGARALRVTVSPFRAHPAGAAGVALDAAVAAEVADIARFLGHEHFEVVSR